MFRNRRLEKKKNLDRKVTSFLFDMMIKHGAKLTSDDGPNPTVSLPGQPHCERPERSLADACVNTHREPRKSSFYMAADCSMERQASLLFGWRWEEWPRRGRGEGGGHLSLAPPPHPLQVKETGRGRGWVLNSPFSIPMDHVTGGSTTETSAPPLTTERVPAS